MDLTEDQIKNHPDYKMYVDNNDGIEDPNLANLCLKTADYLLFLRSQMNSESFQMKVIENEEEVIKTIYKEVKEFDSYKELLNHALEICQNNYFVLHSLNGNTLRYFKVDGSVNLTRPMEDREAEAVVKQVHRNNIISQL